MKFKEFGDKNLPTIIFLHGGGLSWWSWKNIIEPLKDNYHIVTAILDGHGEDGENTFVSIEDSADKLISYIDSQYDGKVYALSGLSIGAQIVTEIISKRKDITQYAIIESALVYPIKGTKFMTVPMFKMCYGLLKKRWFSKLQAKSLFVPENMFELYYKESLNISKQSLINISLSNGNYKLKDIIKDTNSKVLILAGEKELGIMKKSATRLNELIPNSKLKIISKSGHGEISLVNFKEYLNILQNFFAS